VSARAQAEGDVLEHRHVRIERVVLEHHRDVAPVRRLVVDDLPADRDGAFVDVLQPGDGPQQRALAAARLAHQHGELAVGDLQVDAAHGVHVAEGLVQPGDAQVGHVNPSPRRARSRAPGTAA
jgi:hypothetical protein